MTVSSKIVQRKFLDAIKHHLHGWQSKVEQDFSKENFQKELSDLKGDPVYSKFSLDCAEYVLVRLMGRMSISIGRRLGEIYDKLPRFVACARFGLLPENVAEKFKGLEIDIALRYALIEKNDQTYIKKISKEYFKESPESYSGIGIEIRYNFNPNDSSRLRKDVLMGEHLKEAGLMPVYLIYSAISPREDAISRLTRAGWLFLQGEEALKFTSDLFSIDFLEVMEKPEVKAEINQEVKRFLEAIYNSDAFKEVEIISKN